MINGMLFQKGNSDAALPLLPARDADFQQTKRKKGTMNNSMQHPKPSGIVQSSGNSSGGERKVSGLGHAPASRRLMVWLAGLVCLLLAAPAARADRSPTNCAGSSLEISL